MWTTNQQERSLSMVFPKTPLEYLKLLLWFSPNVLTLVPDLQLDVKGCKDIYASFDKYVEVERLEGDNKYHAEQYGLQVSHLLLSSMALNLGGCRENTTVGCILHWKFYQELITPIAGKKKKKNSKTKGQEMEKRKFI